MEAAGALILLILLRPAVIVTHQRAKLNGLSKVNLVLFTLKRFSAYMLAKLLEYWAVFFKPYSSQDFRLTKIVLVTFDALMNMPSPLKHRLSLCSCFLKLNFQTLKSSAY